MPFGSAAMMRSAESSSSLIVAIVLMSVKSSPPKSFLTKPTPRFTDGSTMQNRRARWTRSRNEVSLAADRPDALNTEPAHDQANLLRRLTWPSRSLPHVAALVPDAGVRRK